MLEETLGVSVFPGVIKSINLTNTPHSAYKFSSSRPLTFTDDSLNNLSLSSENSVGHKQFRSNSFAQPTNFCLNNDLSTTNNTHLLTKRSFTQSHETSTILPFQQQLELKLVAINQVSNHMRSQFVSPSQEIFQSKVSEYQIHDIRSNLKNYNSKSPLRNQNVIDLEVQKKISVLIKENEKLMNINEDLVNELETVRKSGQKKGQDVSKSTLNKEISQQNASGMAQELSILKLKLRKFDLDTPQLQQNLLILGTQKLDWQKKLSAILDENDNLNSILQERLMEVDNFNSIIFDLNNQVNELKRTNQIEFQNQQSKFNQLIKEKELILQNHQREISLIKLQQEDKKATQNQQSSLLTLKEKVRELEETLIIKNEIVSQVNSELRNIEVKWREKCKVFQIQVKEQYKIKLKQEYQKIVTSSHGNKQLTMTIQQQQITLNNIQTSLIMFQQENDQLKVMLHDSRDLQQISNQQINGLSLKSQKIWDEEKSNLLGQIQILRQQISRHDHERHQITNDIDQEDEYGNTKTVESFGLKSKYNMLEKNKQVNQQILKKCADLMSRQF